MSAEDICRELLKFIGENPAREGLEETPQRFLKAWKHWTSGYTQDPAEILKTFEDGAEGCDQLILVKDIPIYSHCVVGSTFVETPKGRIPIKHLNDGDWIYTVDPETKELDIVQCQNPRITRKDAELVRVYSDNDTVLCTPDHRFLTYNRGWVEAQNLSAGDSIVSLYRAAGSVDSPYPQLITTRYTQWADKHGAIKIDGATGAVPEHRFVFGKMNNEPIRSRSGRSKIVHHKDGLRWNNLPENLIRQSIHQHNKEHNRFNGETNLPTSPHCAKRMEAVAESSRREDVRQKRSESVKAYWDKVRENPKEYKNRCERTSEGIRVRRNHKIIAVEPVPWREDVYCMTVDRKSVV